MILYLKNFLKHNKYYWKYRHFFESNWSLNYLNNRKQPMIKYYIHLIIEYNFHTIFEFGCAAGTNLFQIKTHNPKLHTIGIDISKSAIKNANQFFLLNNHVNFYFDYKILDVYKYFYHNNILVDLEIIDRTFLYLSDSEILKHIYNIKKISKFIIINDFFYSPDIKLPEFPKHRDYIKLFLSNNFELIETNISLHSKNSKEVSNPQYAFFKNKNLI